MNAGMVLGSAFAAWFLSEVIRDAGRRVDQADILALVDEINTQEFNGWFDPADVMAVIETESSFRPSATRYEPRLGEASIGLMQVLLSTAKDMGYQGGPAGLMDPRTNIRIGMRYLRWLWDYLGTRLGHEPSRAQWFSGYNGGPGYVAGGGLVYSYVNKIESKRSKYA